MPEYDRDNSRSPTRRRKRQRDYDEQNDNDKSRHRSHRSDDYEDRPRKRRSLSPGQSKRDNYRGERYDKQISKRRHSSRSTSPRRTDESRHVKRDRRRSRSRSTSAAAPPPQNRSRAPLPPQNKAFQQEQGGEDSVGPVIEKQKPDFKPSGRLAAASNTVKTAGQTIILKYHEPSESRKPPAKDPWRMYIFKNGEIVDTVPLHEQSCWLFGRELAVCDIPVEHPSASKQHAVIQFRFVEKRNEFGDKVGRVKPYIIDLESGNGTFVNDGEIDNGRYVELQDGDVVKFGHSRREYVLQLPKS